MSMQRLRTALALFGAFSLATLLAAAVMVHLAFGTVQADAPGHYWSAAKVLLRTGDPAEATVWKARVGGGLSFAQVETAIRRLTRDMTLHEAATLPLGDDVAAMQGTPWRKLHIYLYCSPLTAARMIEYSDAFAAHLPCRIALLEDAQGALWLYAPNLDLLFEGGRRLPDGVRSAASELRDLVRDLMERAAAGAL
ncbi:hypothetical protein DKT77_05465 [Meridianimarinicoccus roseus]|uniref:DUF302 domain-containing protein n=2 Tax=Meridianimarinicoccus roseus TaxID=2072018 RepID=A0A2V2LEY1_9RHOB|nr:hypothetical protein DKT77_05465 [Meridianimarinicoccus roseus]